MGRRSGAAEAEPGIQSSEGGCLALRLSLFNV